MISKEKYQFVQKAIQTYSPLKDKIEYVISPKALFSLQKELPLSLCYESNLFPQKNPPISDFSKNGG